VARLLAAAARGEWGPIALALYALVPEYSAPRIDLIVGQASMMDEGEPSRADEVAVEAHPYGPVIGSRRVRAEPARESNFPLMKNA
jgi:hypothetical protein